MRRPGSPGRSSTQQADLKLWPLPTKSPGYGVSVVNNPPLTRREWAGAILGMGLLAAVFLGGALTGRVLSPAAWLYSQAPWSGTAPPADLGPGNGLLSDSVLQFEPWLAYAAQRLHAGALPLWQPANMLGAPFIGNMQSAVFDPLNWPYLLWPDPVMPALRAWLKLLVAALGTYGLARAVLRVGPVPAALAAISFAFSTFLTVWLLYPLTGAVVWLPWLWWATARLIAQPGPRSLAVLAVFAALPLLAGQPEMALHLALATGAWALFCAIRCGGGRQGLTGLALWAGGYALGTLLAAIQVLPFLEYLSQSAAWQARAGTQPDLWLPPYLAWTLVSPLLFGTPIHSDWWDMWTNYNEAANYAGLLPLLLLPFALRERAQRALALFLIGGALLAAGVAYHLPILFDAWTSLPLLRTAANQRLIVFVQFALALLGALGLDAVAGEGRAAPGRLKSRLPLRSLPTQAETGGRNRFRTAHRAPLRRGSAGGRDIPFHYQLQRTAQEAGDVGDGLIGEPRRGQSAGQHLQRDAGFQAGQGRARTEVDAFAEAEMRVGTGSRELALLWGGELGRVVVARAEQRQHPRPGGDHHPAHFRVGGGCAAEGHEGRVQAHNLLYCLRDDGGLGAQQCPMVGLFQQDMHGAADEAGGRFVAGQDGACGLGGILAVGGTFTRHRGLDKDTDKVLPRLGPPCGHHGQHIALIVTDGPCAGFLLLDGQRGKQQHGPLIAPRFDPFHVTRGQAHQIQQHAHRERVGKFAHHFDAPFGNKPGHQLLRDGADARGEFGHAARGKELVEGGAPAFMLRRIGVD